MWLLEKAVGTVAAPGCRRSYERHWTPVHLDIVVDDIDSAIVDRNQTPPVFIGPTIAVT